jgi:hypothetical protein
MAGEHGTAAQEADARAALQNAVSAAVAAAMSMGVGVVVLP